MQMRALVALLALLPLSLALTSPPLSLDSPTSDSLSPPPPTLSRQPGCCALRGSCGRKSTFGGEIPCPDNGPAETHDDAFNQMLVGVCGAEWDNVQETCCTLGQLETLQASLAQAEPLISACPACRLNFRRHYCHFTCAPSQSTFLTVTRTQPLQDADGTPREGVKEVEFSVDPEWAQGFYDSCKEVKFGATNGRAMDLIGGGAKDPYTFLRYMGTERPLGSPFTISYPSPSSPSSPSSSSSDTNTSHSSPPPSTPFTAHISSCSSSSPSERCACPDCPDVCAALPPILSPKERDQTRCKVGKMDCFPFGLVVGYAVALVGGVLGLAASEARTRWTRRSGGPGGIRLEEDEEGESELDLGATTLGDMEDGLGLGTWKGLRHRLSFRGWRGREGGREATSPLLLDSDEVDQGEGAGSNRSRSSSAPSARRLVQDGEREGEVERSSHSSSQPPSHPSLTLSSTSAHPSHHSEPLQPRTYPLSTFLSRLFFRLGFFCASKPYLTLAVGFAVCGVVNLGWKRFEVEKEPVRLWVPEGSEVKREKEVFEEAFGPFYRTEQIFFSALPPTASSTLTSSSWSTPDVPVLSLPTLHYLLNLESRIRSLHSNPSNLTLLDVCFAPTSPSSTDSPAPEAGYCVVQSPLGWFSNSLGGIDETNWKGRVDECAQSPASCLPPFGQPIERNLVLSSAIQGSTNPHQAKAVILTYVLEASLDQTLTAKAEEWEQALKGFLIDISKPGGEAQRNGLRVSWSTGVSLEEELNKATNTDVGVVVASYGVMFAYVALALGGSGGSIVRVLWRVLKLVGVGIVACGRRVRRKIMRRVGGKGTVRLEEEDEGQRGQRSASFGRGARGLGLGGYLRRKLFVEGKFSLALFGIAIVLLSVSTSVALCSAAGVKVTLIIAEVIPFLVLAIGVDNVFLLQHTLTQQSSRTYTTASRHLASRFSEEGAIDDDNDEDEDEDDLLAPASLVARTLSLMGPSILLSASCETVAFGLGALVGMPAVRNFAIYAAVAVAVNTVLQCTVFVAAMALDLERVEANRIDCFPVLKLSTSTPLPPSQPREGTLAQFIRTTYAPTLLKRPVKLLVLAVFGGVFVLSWIGARHVELGLDQRLALPSTSYLVDYFNALDAYLDVGPPVYFVASGVNLTSLDGIRETCGRFSTCDEYSLANVLEAERKRPETSYLAQPPAVWLDDFIQWTNPILEDCCRVKRRNPKEFCGPNDSEYACKPCFEDREPEWSPTLEGFPEGNDLMLHLRQWLASPTDESCPLGGKASYASALSLSPPTNSSLASSTHEGAIELSHFRTYHAPLKSQRDYIEAFAAARRISEDLGRRIGGEVFPYSVFYVFFQSYATLWTTTRSVLAFALASVFFVTSTLLGSFRTGFCITLTTFLSLFTVLGTMGVWSISLNPLSLVNLTVSVGIAVEFAAHLGRAFMSALGGGVPFYHPAGKRDRDERAQAALEEVGAAVLSGIGATKLIGVSVLFLTKSELLKIYYARMWLVLVISSALHGLCLLPVLLSFFGGHGYAISAEDTTGGWIASRYERENLFHDDNESSTNSDEY
ncbi:hypothetical protein JCM11641_002254 [Rhodosporidiobolus odoratus]